MEFCLWVHVPKTGGTSIVNSSGSFFDIRKHSIHLTAKQIKEKSIHVWNNSFKWAFVRNTFDRFVSIYHYRKQILKTDDTKINFKEWMKFSFSQKDPARISQLFYLETNGKIELDFIGRFESLQQDFDIICSFFESKFKLETHNKSRHAHYSQYYDKELINLVKTNCKKELDLFNYDFEYHPYKIY